MFQFTKPIIVVSSVITVFITTALYSIFVPLINNGGKCEYSSILYKDVCESAIGFYIPEWWRIGTNTMLPVSILFGFFCGLSLLLFFLIKLQKET